MELGRIRYCMQGGGGKYGWGGRREGRRGRVLGIIIEGHKSMDLSEDSLVFLNPQPIHTCNIL